MRRREFITLLGGAATGWPIAARAQQPAIPVVSYLSSLSPNTFGRRLAAFRKGLAEAGYVRGQQRRDRIPVGGGSIRPIHRIPQPVYQARTEP